MGKIVEKLLKSKELGCKMVILSGGEPTIRKDLYKIFRICKELGLAVGLITNARRFSDYKYLEGLLKLGLSYVHTSLHGATKETHNEIVQCDAFEQVIKSLDVLSQSDVELHINTVICRLNIGELYEISKVLSGFKGVKHKLTLMEPRGLFHRFENTLFVPPKEAGSCALKDALRARDELGIDVSLEGFPLCQIDGRIDLVSGLLKHHILWMSEVYETMFYPVDHGERIFSLVCEDCHMKGQCPGIYKEYYIRFGDTPMVNS